MTLSRRASALLEHRSNSLRVAGIADPSPLPVFQRKAGINKYRHLRCVLAAGRLGVPARSDYLFGALEEVFGARLEEGVPSPL